MNVLESQQLLVNGGLYKIDLDNINQSVNKETIKKITEKENSRMNTEGSNNSNRSTFNKLNEQVNQTISKSQNLINQVFNSLTNGYNEEISIINLKNKYNASRHPEVVACKKSLDEIKNEFNENLDIFKEYITPLSTSSHDFINYNDFIKFYNQISLGISDEKYFDYLINNVWNLDNGDDKHYYNFGNNIFGMRYGGSSRFSNL